MFRSDAEPGPWPGPCGRPQGPGRGLTRYISWISIKQRGYPSLFLFICTEHSYTSWEVGWKLNETCDKIIQKAVGAIVISSGNLQVCMAAAVFNFPVQRDRKIGLGGLTFLPLIRSNGVMWQVTCDMWNMTGDMWTMTCVMWNMTYDMWNMTCDMSHPTCASWQVTPDTQGVVNIV